MPPAQTTLARIAPEGYDLPPPDATEGTLMLFANRDERRRRLLTEESANPATDAAEEARPAPKGEKTARYADAALHANRLRVTDLVPQQPWLLAVAFLGAVLVVAGLEALYHWMPTFAAQTTDGRIEAFDLDGEGSLAVWFSSTTLIAASAVALLVYSIRRHKADDYHGRYRIWVWAALCWLVMSIDECGSLHEGFKELMTQVAGTRIAGDGSLWWAAAYAIVLGTVGIQLLLEMRECRSSTAAFLATGASYGVAVAAQLGWIMPETGARGVMVEEGAEMIGNLFLLLSMAIHLRYVCLDAEGKVVARPKKERKAKAAKVEATEKTDETEKKTAAKRRSDVAPAPAPVMATQKAAALVEKTTSSPGPLQAAMAARQQGSQLRVDPPQPAGGPNKLSKAERKALRRMQRSQMDDDDE